MYAFLRRSAVLMGLLAAFLSIGLVAPSAARADALPEPKPMPTNVRKLFSVPNQVGGSTLPVAPAPAGTGGQVIKGPWRVFPGTTKVIPPSLLKIVKGGSAMGIGMGSAETAAPLDYIRAGVEWGCAFADFACSEGDRQKKFDTDQGIRDDPGVLGIPLFDDMWAWLTGQTTQKLPDWAADFAQAPSDGTECTKTYKYSGGNNGTFSQSIKQNTFPAGGTALTTYNNACGPNTIGNFAFVRGVCKMQNGTYTGLMGDTRFDRTEGIQGKWSPSTGLSLVSICGTTIGATLVRLVWFTNKTDTSTFVKTVLGEWINPASDMDTVEKTEIQSTVTCKDGGGNTFTVNARTGALDFAGLPQCPDGSRAISYETKGGLPGQEMQIAQGGLADGAEAAAPDCLGNGSSGCAMNVFIDGVQCTVRVAGCADWAPTYAQEPSRFDCKYGQYSVKGSDCLAVLKDAYKTEAGTAWNPQYPNTAPAPITNITNQFITPSPEPWNPISPANPGVKNPANPSPTPGTTPGTGVSPIPITGTNPAFNWDTCISGGGWSWNPVDWVATPVSCSMQAMFKPDPGKGEQRAQAMQAKLAGAGVQPLLTAVGNNVTAIAGVAGGSGCSGPAVNFEAVGVHETIYPFSACEQPLSTLAMMSNAMATLVLIVGGGFGVVRAVAMGFGFNFTMGRGGGSDS